MEIGRIVNDKELIAKMRKKLIDDEKEMNRLMQENNSLKDNEKELKLLQKYAIGGNKPAKYRTINPKVIEQLETSLAPLTLRTIRFLSKTDLVTIILARESFYYKKIDEFNDGIKTNDRIIFKEQQKEISKLNDFLLSESDIFNELDSLKRKTKKKDRIIKDLKKARSMDSSELRRVLSGVR